MATTTDLAPGRKPAAARVKFGVAERCIPVSGGETCASLTDTNKAAWPDVPFDQICDQFHFIAQRARLRTCANNSAISEDKFQRSDVVGGRSVDRRMRAR